MVHDFAKAFGLTFEQINGSYKSISQTTRVISIIGRVGTLLTTKAIVRLVGSQATSTVIEEFARYIPVIGQGVAGGLSFATTYHAGKILLKKIRELALEMAEEIIQTQTASTQFSN